MENNNSVFIIKPEAIKKSSEIKKIIHESGLEIISSKCIKIDEEFISSFYKNADSSLLKNLKKFLTLDNCEIGVVEGEDAINKLRELSGKYSNPSLCKKGSIRNTFSCGEVKNENGMYYKNAFHCSRNIEEVYHEMKQYYSSFAYDDILSAVVSYVKEKCQFEERWKYHLYPVVIYAKKLSEIYNADKEVVELAAWLHDIKRIMGDVENHHITGAELSEDLLKNLGFPKVKIEKVKNCIIKHRGSVYYDNKNIEEKIVACADAMSHFDFRIILFFSAFGRKSMSLEEGTKWIRAKIERSWKKVCLPEAVRMVKDKYDIMKDILSHVGDDELSNYMKKIEGNVDI